jgi:competence ComEA-like helix-hairpin-helix protein
MMSEHEEWMDAEEEQATAAAIDEADVVSESEDAPSEVESTAEDWEFPTGEPEAESGRVDLNTASAEELQKLPGVGRILAMRIVDYRNEEGPFEEPAGIMAVPGISETLYARIADWLILSSAEPEVAEVEMEGEEEPEIAEPEEAEGEAEPEVAEPEDAQAPRLVVPAPEPEMAEAGPAKAEEPEPVRGEEVAPPGPEPPLVEIVPVATIGWGRLFFVGLVSTLLGALIALAVLWIINGTLYFRPAAIAELQAVVFGLEEQSEMLGGKTAQLEGRLEVMQDLGPLVSAAQADIRLLQDDLEEAEAELAAVSGQLEAMQAILTPLSTEVAALVEGRAGMEEDVATLQTRVGALEEQLAAATQQVRRLRQASSRFEAFLDGLQDLLGDSQGTAPEPTQPDPGRATAPAEPLPTIIPLATPTP